MLFSIFLRSKVIQRILTILWVSEWKTDHDHSKFTAAMGLKNSLFSARQLHAGPVSLRPGGPYILVVAGRFEKDHFSASFGEGVASRSAIQNTDTAASLC